MILRGVFLGSREETFWAFNDAAKYFYPELINKIENKIKKNKKNNIFQELGKMLDSGNEKKRKIASNIWMVCLMGIPISYAFYKATTYGYEGFGELWPIRLLGFATGMITFPIITWIVLGEGITIKTAISISLAGIIMILQLI